MNFTLIIISVVVAVILNIVLSVVFSLFATENQKKPPNGAASLNVVGQFMHMMVHHKQVLPMSSFIVGLVVFLSVLISSLISTLI